MPRIMTFVRALAVSALVVTALSAQEPGPAPGPGRDTIEARVRQRMAEVVKRQVGLNDDQMRRLTVTTRKYESQHRDLFQKERELRMNLREELELGDTTRQVQVSRLLDQMLSVQKQRIELMESEQRELAGFMTPHQRARYLGMQEQIRRRMDEMRDQRPGGPGGPGGIRQPPGGGRRPSGGAFPGPGGRRPPSGETPTRAGARPPA